jgi:hypothetical protein
MSTTRGERDEASTYRPVDAEVPATPQAPGQLRDLASDRVLGIVGALTVVVATGLSWYSERISIRVNGALDESSVGVTLWHLRAVAAALLVAGAAIGVVALVLPRAREWRGGMVAAVAGFGITVYSLVAMFTLPSGGSAALLGRFAGVAVSTSLDVGPFVALLGGLILLTGGAAASRESS